MDKMRQQTCNDKSNKQACENQISFQIIIWSRAGASTQEEDRLQFNLSSLPSLTLSLHLPLSPGWNKRVDYEPGTGSKQLFPKMHLETCGGPLSSVRTTVELQTSHIGKGCDRETYSEKSLQKLCGWFCKKKGEKKDFSVVFWIP